jgi:capsule polysaccharide modification protein KpsS
MLHWHHLPQDLELLVWQQGGGSWMVPTNENERRFVFEHPGWEPTYDYRKAIKREILQSFNQHLEEYLDRMESLVEERGCVRTKTKNEPEHFEWLACFQVKGMSYTKIKDRFKPQAPSQKTYLSDDTKAIRKAINDLAKYIGLSLRKDGTAPGRRSSKSRTL